MSDYTPDDLPPFLDPPTDEIGCHRCSAGSAWLAEHDAEIYQRGRVSAARWVEAEVPLGVSLHDHFIWAPAAIAAALGNGAE